VRVLITGVAGFVGSRLARRCLDEGMEVVGVDNFNEYYSPATKRQNVSPLGADARFELAELDLAKADLRPLLHDIEVVFHQAGQPGVRASWSAGFASYVTANVLVTQRLLEASRDTFVTEGRLRRFVYASSSSVYGDALSFPTPEDTVPAPLSPYGVTKLAAEHLCAVYARNWAVPTTSLRYFTVYGGGQRPDMALHRMIEAARSRAPFPLFGDGTQRRDFTHVDDIVSANLAAAERATGAGQVINVAGGSDATVQELLELVGELVGSPVPVDRQPVQAGDVARTGADTTRAHDELGWQPRMSLHDGVAEQVEWHEHRAGTS
jgi:UDP-glucuronate 4-epimerase